MPTEFPSIVAGTAGLTSAAIVSLFLALARPPLSPVDVPRVRRLTMLGVLLHLPHFAEEYSSQFYVRFPRFLGLSPWPVAFFVCFNLGWVAAWIVGAALLETYPRVGIFPIWFLAIASLANGIFHPLVSLATAGYFPGLSTSPLVGALGIVLLRALVSATSHSRGAT